MSFTLPSIRLQVDWPGDNSIIDRRTGAPLRLPKASAWSFEIGVFTGLNGEAPSSAAQVADKTSWVSLTLIFQSSSGTNAVSKTTGTFSTLTYTGWNADTAQHATIAVTQTEANIAPGPYKVCVVIDTVVVGTGDVEVFDGYSLNTLDPADTNPGAPISQDAGDIRWERQLGNPSTNGYVLSSTTGGTRSWVAGGGGGSGDVYTYAANVFTNTNTFGAAIINPADTDYFSLPTVRLPESTAILAESDLSGAGGSLSSTTGVLSLSGPWGTFDLGTGLITSVSTATLNTSTAKLAGAWTFVESGTPGLSGPKWTFELDSIVGRSQTGAKSRFHFRHGQAGNATITNTASEPLNDTGIYWNLTYNTDGTYTNDNNYWPGHDFQLESAWECVTAGTPSFTYTSATKLDANTVRLNGVTFPVAVNTIYSYANGNATLAVGHCLRMFAATTTGSTELIGGPWRVLSYVSGTPGTVTIAKALTGGSIATGGTAFVRESVFEINGGLLNSNSGLDAGFRAIANSISIDSPFRTSTWTFRGENTIFVDPQNKWVGGNISPANIQHFSEDAGLRIMRLNTKADAGLGLSATNNTTNGITFESRNNSWSGAANLYDQYALGTSANTATKWTLGTGQISPTSEFFTISDGLRGHRISIDTSGNVGIGNTAPSTKLDVTGTVTATLFAGSGASLTSIPISTGISGLGISVSAFLADPTAVNFRAILSSATGTSGNRTGSGAAVFAAAPTFTGSTAMVDLSVTGLLSMVSLNNSVTLSPTGTGTVTIAPGTTGAISNVTGSFTTLAASAAQTFSSASGLTLSGNPLIISGNISAAAWTTSGIRIKGTPGTLTDTSSSGTVATAYTDVLGGNTIAASSATTFTNYYSMYVNAGTAGTNVTLTNKWAIGADSLSVGTSNAFQVTSAGVISGAGASFTTLAASGAVTFSGAGAASAPALKATGVPFAGTGTTSFPLVYINDASATASTTLNTAGTYFGVNGDGTQDLMNLLKDGTSQFKVSSAGVVTATGQINGQRIVGTEFLQIGNAGGFIYFVNGGATHPRLGDNGTTLEVKLGDGSAFAPISVSNITASGTLAVTGATTLTGTATLNGDVVMTKTIVTAGTTTSPVTINKTLMQINIAAGATSFVINNSLVATATSIVQATVGSNDATAKSVQAVKGAGTITLYPNAAPTAECIVYVQVIN